VERDREIRAEGAYARLLVIRVETDAVVHVSGRNATSSACGGSRAEEEEGRRVEAAGESDQKPARPRAAKTPVENALEAAL
jgi:hypothetical protein